jgi:hypothetical protein
MGILSLRTFDSPTAQWSFWPQMWQESIGWWYPFSPLIYYLSRWLVGLLHDYPIEPYLVVILQLIIWVIRNPIAMLWWVVGWFFYNTDTLFPLIYYCNDISFWAWTCEFERIFWWNIYCFRDKIFREYFFLSHHWNIFWHIRVYCHMAYVNKFVIEQQFWIFVMNTSGDVGGMNVISSLKYFVNFNLHQIILS